MQHRCAMHDDGILTKAANADLRMCLRYWLLYCSGALRPQEKIWHPLLTQHVVRWGWRVCASPIQPVNFRRVSSIQIGEVCENESEIKSFTIKMSEV